MCMGTVFLCCYPLKTGVVILSTFMMTLGLLGVVFHPLMPYSAQDMGQFLIIYAYTFFLMVAFFLTLLGILSRGVILLVLGLLMGWLLFALWIFLVISGFYDNFCFGLRCAETHWLVPREYAFFQEANETGVAIHQYRQLERKDEIDLRWVDQISTHALHPARRMFEGRTLSPNFFKSVENNLNKTNQDIKIKNVEDKINKLNQDKIKKVEDKINQMNQEHLSSGDRIKLIEGRLNSMNEIPERNSEDRIKLIEGKLNSMNEIPKPANGRPSMDIRIASVEKQINNMAVDIEWNSTEANVEELVGYTKRIPLDEKEMKELLAGSDSRDNAADPPISRGKFRVQNFQKVHMYKCFRHDKNKEPNSASYMTTAFFLRHQLEIAIGLAILYGLLFLCALLTICTELMLFHGKALENQLCCGLGKWSEKQREKSEWESSDSDCGASSAYESDSDGDCLGVGDAGYCGGSLDGSLDSCAV